MMKTYLIARVWLWTVLSVGVLGGCAAPEKVRLFWPTLPNEPKLEYVTTIYSKNSFPRTPNERFLDKMLGAPPANGFARPIGVASRGHKFYVSDPQIASVFELDEVARSMSLFAQGRVQRPVGLATDTNGNVYIADSAQKAVLVFDSAGNPLGSFKQKDTLKYPTFVALNEVEKRVYITDVEQKKIVVFNQKGEYLFSFPKADEPEAKLHTPAGLTVDPETGNVIVCDQFNFRIVIFDKDGKFVKTFGKQGDSPGLFEQPRDVAVDSEGHIYVADYRKAAVSIFDQNGDFLLQLGKGRRTASPVGFSTPSGIWIDQKDRIFIADQFNKYVVIWQYLNEDYLQQHPITQKDLELFEEVIERSKKPSE